MNCKQFIHSISAAAVYILCTAAVLHAAPDKPLVIVFESDVHGQIDQYAAFVGLRQSIAAADTAWVGSVCAGDFLHGTPVATADSGRFMPAVLNAVGHDAITLGNHEFDMPLARQKALLDQVTTGITCCNLIETATGKTVYAPYIMKAYGPYRVAYIGVLTPNAMQGGSKNAFYAPDGSQRYDLSGQDLAARVQATVDAARQAGATHVVVLAHLGSSERMSSVTTPQLIAATRGIDAVVDSHSHTVNPGATAVNLDGKPIAYAQTGNKLQRAGILTIAPSGQASTQLVSFSGTTYSSETVAKAVAEAYAASGTSPVSASSMPGMPMRPARP